MKTSALVVLALAIITSGCASPMEAAVRSGDYNRAQALLQSGVEADSYNTSWGFARPIVLAAEKGDLKMIKLLVEHGAKLGDDTTPLTVAAMNGHRDVCRYLIEKGLDAQKVVDLFGTMPRWDPNGAATRLLQSLMAAPAVAAAPAGASAAPAPAFQSDVETPSFRRPEDETKFALVVGVENYQTAMKAEHAARDARAVKAHLEAAGYPDRNIIFLVDQQAGKSALEKYIEAWLPRNTDERSTVLFFFSGHGAPDPEKGQAYLMPWDADAKFTETTGYSVKRLYAKLDALKARRVLVAMDACFSGAGPRSVIGKGLRPLVSKVDDGAGSAGRVGALTASASDEMTGSDDASGHGLFTYHLLKALNARGGAATLKELFDSLSPKVRDAARRDNRDQTPQLVGDGRATL